MRRSGKGARPYQAEPAIFLDTRPRALMVFSQRVTSHTALARCKVSVACEHLASIPTGDASMSGRFGRGAMVRVIALLSLSALFLRPSIQAQEAARPFPADATKVQDSEVFAIW